MTPPILLLLAIYPFGKTPAPALVDPNSVTLTGNFVRQGWDPRNQWLDPTYKDQATFGSFGNPSLSSGSLTTGVFRAPAAIELYITGYPNHQGSQIYLRDEANPVLRLYLVTPFDLRSHWRQRIWQIPEVWRDKLVRLVAEDASPGVVENWFALGLPRAAHPSASYSLLRAAWRAVLMSLYGSVLLLPGFAVAWAIHARWRMEAHRLAIVAFVATGLVGYISFWVYFLGGTAAGHPFSFAIPIAALCTIVLTVRTYRNLFPRGLKSILSLMLLVAFLYSALGFLYIEDENSSLQLQQRFFAFRLPPDNVLPEMLIDRLARNQSLIQPNLFLGWQASDRPPLQAGLVVLEAPFWDGIDSDFAYELASIFLQCSWVLGAWTVMVSLRLPNRTIVPVLSFCILSGFCFVNSAFVWPKLLAAAFCLMGLSFFFTKDGATLQCELWEWFLAGLCFGLSLLSHSGTAFTLLGVLVLFLVERKPFAWRRALAGAACAFALMVPWIIFQKFYNPPGDQLIKLAVAGDLYHDLSLTQALAKAYREIPLSDVFKRRWEDFQLLFTRGPLRQIIVPALAGDYEIFLEAQFFSFYFAIGLLNLGFFVRIWTRLRNAAAQVPDQFVYVVLISFVFWMTVMYQPFATVIHQGSYANMLLMMIAGGIYLASAFPRGIYGLLAIQAFGIFPISVFNKKSFDPVHSNVVDYNLDPGMAAVAIACLVCMTILAWRSVKAD